MVVMGFNPPDAETKILQDNLVDFMATIALVPCIAMLSAAMSLARQEKWVLSSMKDNFNHLCLSVGKFKYIFIITNLED